MSQSLWIAKTGLDAQQTNGTIPIIWRTLKEWLQAWAGDFEDLLCQNVHQVGAIVSGHRPAVRSSSGAGCPQLLPSACCKAIWSIQIMLDLAVQGVVLKFRYPMGRQLTRGWFVPSKRPRRLEASRLQVRPPITVHRMRPVSQWQAMAPYQCSNQGQLRQHRSDLFS